MAYKVKNKKKDLKESVKELVAKDVKKEITLNALKNRLKEATKKDSIPGLAVTAKVHKEAGKDNKEGVDAIVKKIKDYKHNKKKGELEKRLNLVTQHNGYFLEVFEEEFVEINGQKHGIHWRDTIAKWDKDDLVGFEEKIKKLEDVKDKVDGEHAIRHKKIQRRNSRPSG